MPALSRNLRQGHDVLPVNPRESQIEGVKCWPSVSEPPGARGAGGGAGGRPIDRVLFYVPPAVGLQVIEALAQRGDVSEVWLNPGAESDTLIARAQTLGFQPIMACAIVDIGERP